MKRLYQVLMGLILLVVLTPGFVFASGEVHNAASPMKLSVDEVSAEPEEEVQVPLVLSDNSMGICGATLTVSYDEHLVLKGVNKGTGLSTLTMTKPGDLSANPVNIVWDGEKEDTSEGAVAILTFVAPKQAGTYPIVLTYEEGDIIDGDLTPVYLLIQNGSITVADNRTDEERAAEFTAVVNTLDGSDKESIQNAIKAYNLLTDEQKALLTPEVLEKLETARQDLDAASAAEKYIKVLSEDEESSVTSAREVYEALSENQKKLVDPALLKKLEDAEKALEEAELKRKADQEAADAFSAVINTMDATDKTSVAVAREQYEALSDDQKALVDKAVLKKLTDAEETIQNQDAADGVSAAINTMDATDKASVTAAREQYEALSDDQKALVDAAVLKKLTDAEEAIVAADQAAADAVADVISSMDASNKDSVAAARAQYDELSDDQKALIDAAVFKKLTDAEDSIREADQKEISDKAAADNVNSLIIAASASDPASVEKARNAYNKLTDEQKTFVDKETLNQLDKIEQIVKTNQETANKVTALIASLPESITSKDAEAVQLARKAYENLTEDQKKQVAAATVEKLKSAEKTISDLGVNVKTQRHVKVGKTYVVKKMKYKVIKNDNVLDAEVILTGTTVKKSKLKKLVVPDFVVIDGEEFWVAAIGNNAFKNCKSLKSVKIGEFVESIGKKAFYNDKKLKKITIRSKYLKKVQKNAIKGIHKKAVIKVPATKLKDYKKLFKKKTGFTKKMKLKK